MKVTSVDVSKLATCQEEYRASRRKAGFFVLSSLLLCAVWTMWLVVAWYELPWLLKALVVSAFVLNLRTLHYASRDIGYYEMLLDLGDKLEELDRQKKEGKQ